jgi:hypothetical protein
VSEVDLPVAVDALGGDHAPDVLVAAALKAARSGVLVRLVGDVSIPGRRRPNTLSILQRGTAFPARHIDTVSSARGRGGPCFECFQRWTDGRYARGVCAGVGRPAGR